jgi:hypothetical protein
MTPFVVFALPRSRSFWLSHALSYGEYHCAHEQSRHFRSLDDVRAWLSQDFTGAVETMAAPWWRMVSRFRPDMRVLVVRRPVDEVVDSLMRLDMRGVCAFDPAVLRRQMQRLDAKLDQIECRMANVLSVRYCDLDTEAPAIFEHCLPYAFDPAWWGTIQPINLQASMPALMRYMISNGPALNKLAAMVTRDTLTAFRPRKRIDREDITIQRESCETWYRDGKRLFEEHSIELGEAPDDYQKRNWPLMMKMDEIGAMHIMTARCNGRMVGYYVCYVAPATNDATLVSALQISIFASRDFPGIGMRLKRAATESLRERGIGEVNFRAGINADGARMGAIHEREGAECIGRIYRLDLRRAA